MRGPECGPAEVVYGSCLGATSSYSMAVRRVASINATDSEFGTLQQVVQSAHAIPAVSIAFEAHTMLPVLACSAARIIAQARITCRKLFFASAVNRQTENRTFKMAV
jgi:hypothetical protein